MSEDLSIQQEQYDRELYSFQLSFKTLYNGMKSKDCSMEFSESKYQLFNKLQSIEGIFPFHFVLFIDKYLINRYYLIIYTTDSTIQDDYADFISIYPQIDELKDRDNVAWVKVINPLSNQRIVPIDHDFKAIEQKFIKYYRAISQIMVSKIPKKYYGDFDDYPLIKYVDDWVTDYFQEIHERDNPPNPEPDQSEGIPFFNFGGGVPDFGQILNNLSKKDMEKLMRGETIDLNFGFPNGFASGFIKGIPIKGNFNPFNQSMNPNANRHNVIQSVNEELDKIIHHYDIITPEVDDRVIKKIYGEIERDGVFSTPISTTLQNYLGSEKQFRKFIYNIIRQYIKHRDDE